jgi:hypothetical protein
MKVILEIDPRELAFALALALSEELASPENHKKFAGRIITDTFPELAEQAVDKALKDLGVL